MITNLLATDFMHLKAVHAVNLLLSNYIEMCCVSAIFLYIKKPSFKILFSIFDYLSDIVLIVSSWLEEQLAR